MAKLTLEKAKELLKNLQYAKAQMGQLSLNDEMYKQALEIAIPHLEMKARINEAANFAASRQQPVKPKRGGGF